MPKWLSIPKVSSRRGIGRSFIPKLQAQGFSTPKALAWLKGHGGGYRKTDFLSDWRQMLGISRKKEALKHVRKDYLPTRNVIAPTYDDMSARYKATWKVVGTNKETGLKNDFFISAMSDDPLTMKQWDEVGIIVAYNEKYLREYDIDSMEIDSILEQVYE